MLQAEESGRHRDAAEQVEADRSPGEGIDPGEDIGPGEEHRNPEEAAGDRILGAAEGIVQGVHRMAAGVADTVPEAARHTAEEEVAVVDSSLPAEAGAGHKVGRDKTLVAAALNARNTLLEFEDGF
jgi:hypothetical protein